MNFCEIGSKCVKVKASYRILRSHVFERGERPNASTFAHGICRYNLYDLLQFRSWSLFYIGKKKHKEKMEISEGTIKRKLHCQILTRSTSHRFPRLDR